MGASIFRLAAISIPGEKGAHVHRQGAIVPAVFADDQGVTGIVDSGDAGEVLGDFHQEVGVGEDLRLVGVDKARFKRPALPGDQIVMTVDMVASRRNLWRFDARAEVNGEVVVSAELLQAPGKML